MLHWGLPKCMLGYTPPGADTPPPETRHAPQTDTPPAQCMLENTVNKRAVRILLECDLVQNEIECYVLIILRNECLLAKAKSRVYFSAERRTISSVLEKESACLYCIIFRHAVYGK